MSTQHYDLNTISSGGRLSEDGYKFSDADRKLIDLLLYYGAEGHRHDGEEKTPARPDVPSAVASQIGGFLQSGTTFYYKTSFMTVEGIESGSSDSAAATTASPLSSPEASTLIPYQAGGTLRAGAYAYSLSVWVGSETLETEAASPSGLTLPARNASTQRVEIEFPAPPPDGGATRYGYNIYRKGPGDARYQLLDSVDYSAYSRWEAPAAYVYDGADLVGYMDDGSVEPDCNRIAPRVNTTSTENQIRIDVGAIPSGATWKLYRTTDPGSWTNSFLTEIVEPTTEGGTDVIDFFVDKGQSPNPGSPLAEGFKYTSPSKIDLGTEVEGIAVPASLTFAETVEYSMPGKVFVQNGTFLWRCPYDDATIRDVCLTAGAGYSAGPGGVVANVDKLSGGSTVSLFSGDLKLNSGQQLGVRVTPSQDILSLDDCLSINIESTDDGSAEDLSVQIRLFGSSQENESPFTPPPLGGGVGGGP